MAAADNLVRGRQAYRYREWSEALALLAEADRDHRLGTEDLVRLADAAYLTGRGKEGNAYLARAHRAWLEQADRPGAARCAIRLYLHLLLQGEANLAGGWLARARRLLADGPECVEQGYLLVPEGLILLERGDTGAAAAAFNAAAAAGSRFADPDLQALGRTGLGQLLIAAGSVGPAMAQLDEVMVAVTAGEVSPVTAGIVLCAVIDSCLDAFDLPRAQEWTAVLTQWCASQPDPVSYRGQCLVHRARLLQLQGDWPDALAAAEDARLRLTGPVPQPAVGAALYQQAELYRLAGQFTAAEEMYLQASRRVGDPQPGLALLQLMCGEAEAAAASIRRVLSESRGRVERARLLGAGVEILLAVGDVQAAGDAAAELGQLAAEFGGAWLEAEAAQGSRAVLMARHPRQTRPAVPGRCYCLCLRTRARSAQLNRLLGRIAHSRFGAFLPARLTAPGS